MAGRAPPPAAAGRGHPRRLLAAPGRRARRAGDSACAQPPAGDKEEREGERGCPLRGRGPRAPLASAEKGGRATHRTRLWRFWACRWRRRRPNALAVPFKQSVHEVVLKQAALAAAAPPGSSCARPPTRGLTSSGTRPSARAPASSYALGPPWQPPALAPCAAPTRRPPASGVTAPRHLAASRPLHEYLAAQLAVEGRRKTKTA